MRANQERRNVSVALCDYNSTQKHRNGINSMIVTHPEDSRHQHEGTCNLFTASRDRLIKLWSVDYAKLQTSSRLQTDDNPGLSLLADLDDHTDWVNQIKVIEEVNTLISCSNDTTILVWRYKSNDSYISRNQKIRSQRGEHL